MPLRLQVTPPTTTIIRERMDSPPRDVGFYLYYATGNINRLEEVGASSDKNVQPNPNYAVFLQGLMTYRGN